MTPTAPTFELKAGNFPEAFSALEARIFADAWLPSSFSAGAGRLAFSLWRQDSQDCLGYAYGSTVLDEAELLRIATAPECRAQGLGRRLLQAFQAACRERGIRRIFLEVAEDNQPAIGLYFAHGFQQTGRRPHYYGRDRAALNLVSEL